MTEESVKEFQQFVKKIGATIGRPDVTTHSLRHTFATLCLELEDVSLREVGASLGHASERTTRIYAHTGPSRQRKIAEKLPSFELLIA